MVTSLIYFIMVTLVHMQVYMVITLSTITTVSLVYMEFNVFNTIIFITLQ
jgi:hypothetical protein